MDLHPITLLLLLNLAPAAAAQQELSACYILDGILIIYGLLLTVLYCRLKMHSSARGQVCDGGVYQNLERPDSQIYNTLHGIQKPPLA